MFGNNEWQQKMIDNIHGGFSKGDPIRLTGLLQQPSTWVRQDGSIGASNELLVKEFGWILTKAQKEKIDAGGGMFSSTNEPAEAEEVPKEVDSEDSIRF